MRIRELLIDLCHDVFYLGCLLFKKNGSGKEMKKKTFRKIGNKI